MLPLRVSRMRKKNGWSARKTTGGAATIAARMRHDPRGRCRLGSLLLDLHERLMHHRRDREVTRAGHPREIGFPKLKSDRHPQLRKRVLQLERFGELELGKADLDPSR